MNKTQPLVSILMNCFNGEKYLTEAIKSILNQSYKNWELIFWDNQSTDQSAKIFKSFKDKRMKYYYSSKHTHLGGGRAEGYKRLKGDLVAILDTDDIWFPDKLLKQVHEFTNKDIGIVITNAYRFSAHKKKPIFESKYPVDGFVFNSLLNNYYVCLPTLMVRKSFVDDLTRQFDPEFNYISDFDLVLRLSSVCKLKYINEILAGWRLHGANASLEKPFLFQEEKELWIKKMMISDKHIVNKYSLDIDIFRKNILRQKAFLSLLNNKRIEALSLVMKTKLKTIKDLIVFLLIISLIPSKILMKLYIYKINKV